MKNGLKKLTVCGLMTAVCLILGYLEHLLPLSLIIPLPGIKLGLSNIALLVVLLMYGPAYAYGVTALKCGLSALLFGSVTSLAFSLTGGLLAMTAMWLLTLAFKEKLSVFGVSVAGAVMHNVGQLSAASVIMGSAAVFSYLPLLATAGTVTGLVTAAVASRTLHLLGYEKDAVLS